MRKRIVVVGAGAVGGYVGGHLARNGEDVTLVDPWPEHVNRIKARGIELSGTMPEERCTVPVAAMHLCDVQGLSKQPPIDIAFVCTKAYDTDWASMLIRPYLAPRGFLVSLQNGINEETMAGIVGWGRVVGCVASLICVEVHEPGQVRRSVPLGGERHVVFRIGEVHGCLTARIQEVARMLRAVDSAEATTNLWGERWSKLAANCMRNALMAVTSLGSAETDRLEGPRRLAVYLGGEAVRVGRALGHQLVDVWGLSPQRLEAAATGDSRAMAEIEAQLLERSQRRSGGHHRASMAQDVLKGRRTEVDHLNGLVCAKGAALGIPTPANAALAELVRRIERGELEPGLELVADVCRSLPRG